MWQKAEPKINSFFVHGLELTGLCRITRMIITIEIGTCELKKANERCYNKLVRNIPRINSKKTIQLVFLACIDALDVFI